MKIYIVDYLGIHCGMHYYNDAFCRVLTRNPEAEVVVLSNYVSEQGGKPFFRNQYRGRRWQKIYALFLNYWRLWRFVRKHHTSCFIYLTYGNRIDLPFMKIISGAKRHLIDIHEAIAQCVDGNLRLKRRFQALYCKQIENVIVHSERTDDFLDEYGYKGGRLHVPHFKYCFQKKYDLQNIGTDIQLSVDTEKINILFFGNINYSKGVDILIEAVNLLPDDIAAKANIVIAGKDFDGAINRVQPQNKDIFRIILRHINDDELVYLYEHVDYVALPYRKTSQSGILEMAFYFKKPIIASDVPYFREMLSRFPSFGLLAGLSSESYAQMLNRVLEKERNNFFVQEEYACYTHRKEIEEFYTAFYSWLRS